MRSGKWTALLCAGAMLLTAAPTGAISAVTAYAEETTATSGTCGENLTWKFDESTGTLTVSGEGRMDDHPMDFTGIYDMSAETTGYPEILVKRDEVTSIVIEEGVTYLGDFWFYRMENLTSVTLPYSIETGVFNFRLSPWLESIEPDENGLRIVNGILLEACDRPEDTLVIPSTVKHIAGGAFVKTGEGALFGAPMIYDPVSVEIPSSVETIGSAAFERCEITDITILNPDCIIDPYSGIAPKETISGYDNSTAQAYAEENGYTFKSLGAAPEPGADVLLGDVNLDAKVDASDAADLLIALAEIGAGGENPLSDAQKAAADADGNGELNAGDAATILQYAAFIGAGGTGTLPDFLRSFA